MRIYRIADRRHPPWDGFGAALVGGRWNSPGQPAIYGSLSFACALLEVLAHAGMGRIPTTHQFVFAEVDEGAGLVERHDERTIPGGWDREDSQVARRFGDEWLSSCRSLVLVVPSVVSRLDFNAVVNPAHPAFPDLVVSPPAPVVWDARLFRPVG